MTKLLQILLLSVLFFTFGCEGPIGPKGEDGLNGEDGEDGVSNIQTIYTEITSNNVVFTGNSSDGYLTYVLETDLITQSVVDSGVVIVEISTSNDPYVWTPLPKINFDGDNSDVNYMFVCEYSYDVGKVYIGWDTSYAYNFSEWLTQIGMWGVYYKVTIVSPS